MVPKLLRKLCDKSPEYASSENSSYPSQSARCPWTAVSEDLKSPIPEKPSKAETKSRNAHDCVQICPHESLSFDRMKRITHLPYFKYSGDTIGAFTNAPGFHHMAGTHLCKPYPKDFSSLTATGFYKYRRGFEGDYNGLVLLVHWTMDLDEHSEFTGSVSNLQRLLGALQIQLCEHTMMDDLRIATSFYRLCNPSRPAGDPVEAYEEVHGGRKIEKCQRCHTTFETYKTGKTCHILVMRYLGKGDSVYEKRWLAQCGAGKHRLRSLGAAALQWWRT